MNIFSQLITLCLCCIMLVVGLVILGVFLNYKSIVAAPGAKKLPRNKSSKTAKEIEKPAFEDAEYRESDK